MPPHDIVEEFAQIIIEDDGIDVWFLEDFIPEGTAVEVEMPVEMDSETESTDADAELLKVYVAMRSDDD
jgi:hypothetical protein